MKTMKLVVAGAALLGSTAAFAGATGNAGAFSTYMFRGIDQSLGAAGQGGVDLSTAGGFYAGAWVSTTTPGVTGSSYETDLYAGWTGSGFDLGYIFYGYRDTGTNNFSEVYAGWSGAGFSVKGYFSPEFAATEDDGIYVTASYAIALSDSLSLVPQIGSSSGDGVELAVGDSYMDYSLSLTKSLKDGFTFSLGYVANDLDDGNAFQEEGQAVVSLKKSFDL